MNNNLFKGIAIVTGVVLVLAIGMTVLTDDGWRKLDCVARAIAHGVALSNIHAVCAL